MECSLLSSLKGHCLVQDCPAVRATTACSMLIAEEDCTADFVDDGQQLSDEEWAEFFQTQLDHVRKEAAGQADGSGEDATDPDDPFHGLPDPFDDDLSMPGVRLCNIAGLGASPLSSANVIRARSFPTMILHLWPGYPRSLQWNNIWPTDRV